MTNTTGRMRQGETRRAAYGRQIQKNVPKSENTLALSESGVIMYKIVIVYSMRVGFDPLSCRYQEL